MKLSDCIDMAKKDLAMNKSYTYYKTKNGQWMICSNGFAEIHGILGSRSYEMANTDPV